MHPQAKQLFNLNKEVHLTRSVYLFYFITTILQHSQIKTKILTISTTIFNHKNIRHQDFKSCCIILNLVRFCINFSQRYKQGKMWQSSMLIFYGHNWWLWHRLSGWSFTFSAFSLAVFSSFCLSSTAFWAVLKWLSKSARCVFAEVSWANSSSFCGSQPQLKRWDTYSRHLPKQYLIHKPTLTITIPIKVLKSKFNYMIGLELELSSCNTISSYNIYVTGSKANEANESDASDIEFE